MGASVRGYLDVPYTGVRGALFHAVKRFYAVLWVWFSGCRFMVREFQKRQRGPWGPLCLVRLSASLRALRQSIGPVRDILRQ